jgi:cytochrome c-type biogenesis protein CcmH/NrfG
MHISLGQDLATRGEHAKALNEFKEALQREPKQPLAMLGFASESIWLKDYASAREMLDRAAAYPFVTASVLQLRGALDSLEKGIDRTSALKAAADAAPWDWTFRKRYLLALDQTGHTDVAARELRAFLEQQPFRGDSWKLLGDLLTKMHQRTAAVTAYAQAVRLDVHDEAARQSLRILTQSAQIQGSAP